MSSALVLLADDSAPTMPDRPARVPLLCRSFAQSWQRRLDFLRGRSAGKTVGQSAKPTATGSPSMQPLLSAEPSSTGEGRASDGPATKGPAGGCSSAPNSSLLALDADCAFDPHEGPRACTPDQEDTSGQETPRAVSPHLAPMTPASALGLLGISQGDWGWGGFFYLAESASACSSRSTTPRPHARRREKQASQAQADDAAVLASSIRDAMDAPLMDPLSPSMSVTPSLSVSSSTGASGATSPELQTPWLSRTASAVSANLAVFDSDSVRSVTPKPRIVSTRKAQPYNAPAIPALITKACRPVRPSRVKVVDVIKAKPIESPASDLPTFYRHVLKHARVQPRVRLAYESLGQAVQRVSTTPNTGLQTAAQKLRQERLDGIATFIERYNSADPPIRGDGHGDWVIFEFLATLDEEIREVLIEAMLAKPPPSRFGRVPWSLYEVIEAAEEYLAIPEQHRRETTAALPQAGQRKFRYRRYNWILRNRTAEDYNDFYATLGLYDGDAQTLLVRSLNYVEIDWEDMLLMYDEESLTRRGKLVERILRHFDPSDPDILQLREILVEEDREARLASPWADWMEAGAPVLESNNAAGQDDTVEDGNAEPKDPVAAEIVSAQASTST